MKLVRSGMSVLAGVGLLLTVAGCGGAKQGDEYKQFTPHDVKTAPSDHGHGEAGPHGGDIVELGDEGFHAEVVVTHGDKDEIAVHVLGGDAKTAKPIAATEIVLSFKHGDKVEEFKLAATKQEGDAEGQASLFKLESEEAMEELHEHGEGTLTIKVGDKTLTGTVKHAH